MPTAKITGVKSADSRIGGELWEVKTNRTPTISAVDNALRSCNSQARNLVLNVESDISNKSLMAGITGCLPRTEIEKIIIVRGGRIAKRLSRDSLLKQINPLKMAGL